MSEQQILDKCTKKGWSIEEYFVYWAYVQKSKGYDIGKLLDRIAVANPVLVFEHLINTGVLVNGNIPGQTFNPSYVSLSTSYRDEEEERSDWFDEFFNTYPATFPIDSGRSFIARTGGDKNTLRELYMSKVADSDKQAFVMTQLARYISMVERGKVNGRRLVDFVNEELWDTIATITDDSGKSVFKTDI